MIKWIAAAVLFMNSPMAFTAQQYIDDVLSGRQVACKLVHKAVERHVRDLDRVGDPDFPYVFDPAHARRAIAFQQLLRHTQGEWANPHLHDTRIRLEPWQQFIDWSLFGWRRTDGYRRFTKVLVAVSRKNGKTTKAAATLNYVYFADSPREIGPQAYCVATKKDQAKIAWEEAKRQVEKHPVLRRASNIFKQNSTITLVSDSAAKCTIWGKDADTQDGFNPSFALVDEAHAYPDHSMLEVLESGMGSRRQPLIYIITTAGFDINAPIFTEEWSLAVQILERTVDPVPENYFAIIYTLDDDDDWLDPAVWVKANPNIGVSVSREYLQKRVDEALQMPSRRNDILTKNFNIWTHVATRWIQPEAWGRCTGKVNEESLIGRECYLGLDLSTSIDITAYCLVFPPMDDDLYRMLWRFYIPEENLIERIRRDKVPYDVWIEDGLVCAIPGPTIKYGFIEQDIEGDAIKYRIKEIGFDPYNAAPIVESLSNAGYKMIPIHQRYQSMSAPTKEFETLTLSRRIAHGGNPVMAWMVSCAEVKSDRQGNIMPMKPQRDKSGKRIDGVVAAIMGLDRAIRNGTGKSVYEDRGLLAV